MHPSRLFDRMASQASQQAGRPWALIAAVASMALWAATGPLMGFSDSWQLIVNTLTSVVTFIMVFLIQNAQNRDTQAIQLKLDELIRATEGARNHIIALESQGDAAVEKLREEHVASCREAGA